MPKLNITPDIKLAGRSNLRSYSLSCPTLGVLQVAHFLNKNMNWKLQATKEMVPFFLYHYFQKWEITNIFLLEKQLKNILDTNLLIMFIGSVDTYPFKDVISKIESLDFVFSMTELKEEKYPDIFDIYTQIKNSFMPTA